MVWRVWVLVVVVVLAGAGCSFKPLVLTPKAATPDGVAPVVVSVPTVLVLDGSGSMTTDDAPGPRIDAARTAAHTLIGALPDDARIGLQTYGTTTGSAPEDKRAGCRDVTTLIPLGPLNRQQFTTKIDTITPSGYTPISLALTTAADQLPKDSAPQAIVVVSDGEDTCDTPPCDTAAALKKTHPGLTISTVGFKLDGPAADQLRCIATTTGGLFVHAANATQLTTRLLATQNLDQANQSLSATGMNGIDLGTHIGDIRTAHPDFPEANTTGTVTVIWKDCDYTFTDGTLSAIAPHNGGRTIDGLSAGNPVTKATDLYGPPLSTTPNTDNTTTLTYDADPNTPNAYQMKIEDYNTTGTNTPTGTITTITLCKCKPQVATALSADEVASLPVSPPPDPNCPGEVKESTDIRHPHLGPVRVFLLLSPSGGSGQGCIAPVAANVGALPTIPVTVYGDELAFANPATDATGNTFVTYNPGRYDGVIVLVPDRRGFQDMGWDVPDVHYSGKRAYYYAQLVGPGSDGAFAIEQSHNDCTPDCAGGKITRELLRWNGHDYLP